MITVDYQADKVSDRSTQVSIQISIPVKYQKQPVISQIISRFGLTVNIRSALLLRNTPGKFNLELQGTAFQIQSALTYLDELNLTALIFG